MRSVQIFRARHANYPSFELGDFLADVARFAAPSFKIDLFFDKIEGQDRSKPCP